MNLQQITFIKECTSCQAQLGIRETYMHMDKNPFIAAAVPMGARHLVAKMKLSRMYLTRNEKCFMCHSKTFHFNDIMIDEVPLYQAPSDECAFVEIEVKKVNGEVFVGFKPINKGERTTKFIIKSFYDSTLKALGAVDDSLFISKGDGIFYCKVYNDPRNNYSTSINDIYFKGMSKKEVVDAVEHGKNYYMKQSGIDKYQY